MLIDFSNLHSMGNIIFFLIQDTMAVGTSYHKLNDKINRMFEMLKEGGTGKAVVKWFKPDNFCWQV